jgi:hypothetical protein
MESMRCITSNTTPKWRNTLQQFAVSLASFAKLVTINLPFPWNLDITDGTKQDRFTRPTDCCFAPMMIDDDNDNLNRWNFVKVESIPGEFEEDEVNAVEIDILQDFSCVNRVAEDIEKGGYGAINADEDDGYWLAGAMEWRPISTSKRD